MGAAPRGRRWSNWWCSRGSAPDRTALVVAAQIVDELPVAAHQHAARPLARASPARAAAGARVHPASDKAAASSVSSTGIGVRGDTPGRSTSGTRTCSSYTVSCDRRRRDRRALAGSAVTHRSRATRAVRRGAPARGRRPPPPIVAAAARAHGCQVHPQKHARLAGSGQVQHRVGEPSVEACACRSTRSRSGCAHISSGASRRRTAWPDKTPGEPAARAGSRPGCARRADRGRAGDSEAMGRSSRAPAHRRARKAGRPAAQVGHARQPIGAQRRR